MSNNIGDFNDHREILLSYIHRGALPGNFIYYGVLYFFSIFNFNDINNTAAIILGLSVGAKWQIAASNSINSIFGLENKLIKKEIVYFTTLLLLLFHPLLFTINYNTNFYLGKFPLSVWHNSTTIFLIPFALWLFFASFSYLENPSFKKLCIVCLICLLNIFIKPSFFFSFIIVFPFYAIYTNGFRKSIFHIFILLTISFLALFLQFYLLYLLDDFMTGKVSKVVIKPLFVWSFFTKNKLLDLLTSIIFPLSFALMFFKQILKIKKLIFAWFLFISALLIFCILAEDGPRLYHGNFVWQVYVCNFILHLVTLQELLKCILNNSEKIILKVQLLILLFGFGCFCGIIYLLKILWLKNYL
jgi:hypothetical protein